VDNVEASEMPTGSESFSGIAAEDDHEKYILELQPANRGLQIQILEADLVLWTVGSKPLLPELQPSGKPHELPLNARGQAETDETLRVKGHPRIFAIGDSAALRDSNGRLLPATAQVLE
jgi:NADH:ubiquinone reductase (non-electrogenic)